MLQCKDQVARHFGQPLVGSPAFARERVPLVAEQQALNFSRVHLGPDQAATDPTDINW
jgi:hypothetical protein